MKTGSSGCGYARMEWLAPAGTQSLDLEVDLKVFAQGASAESFRIANVGSASQTGCRCMLALYPDGTTKLHAQQISNSYNDTIPLSAHIPIGQWSALKMALSADSNHPRVSVTIDGKVALAPKTYLDNVRIAIQ